MDRDLVLFSSRIIMEYLDERHTLHLCQFIRFSCEKPPLMLRIEQDWYPTLEIAEKGTEAERRSS